MHRVIQPSTTRPAASAAFGHWAARRSIGLRIAARRLVGVLLCVGLTVACGKKGPPLAPRQRVPAKVGDWTVARADDHVFLSLTVPAANVAGDQPADLGQVEVYALTSATPPILEAGKVPAGVTLVASSPVRRPLAPLPPAAGNAPALPTLPVEPGLDQGAKVTFRERLTPALTQDTASPAAAIPVTAALPAAAVSPALSLPPVYLPAITALRRHYVAVAVSRRGRRGPWSDWKSVPMANPAGAPSAPVATFDDKAIAVAWTPAPDATSAPPPPVDGALASRPFGPAVPATRYNLYDAAAEAATAGDTVTRPAPLNTAALPTPAFSLAGVVFDAERCFVVRGLDTIGGVDVEGPASARGCVTPRDTFPPTAPAALEAVAGAGVISLIWEAVEAPDLAGYLVFRGTAPGEPTTLITPTPISATSVEDRSVTPGVRYVYVVVAIDSATLANRSAPSNRAEETARQ